MHTGAYEDSQKQVLLACLGLDKVWAFRAVILGSGCIKGLKKYSNQLVQRHPKP